MKITAFGNVTPCSPAPNTRTCQSDVLPTSSVWNTEGTVSFKTSKIFRPNAGRHICRSGFVLFTFMSVAIQQLFLSLLSILYVFHSVMFIPLLHDNSSLQTSLFPYVYLQCIHTSVHGHLTYISLWYDVWYDMIWYDMICCMVWCMIRHDMTWYMLYDIWYDIIYMIYDMMRYNMIRYDMFYDMIYMTWYMLYDIWYDIYDTIWYMIWCETIRYGMIWYDIWCDILWYDKIWYDMILFSAIRFLPCGSGR